MRVRLLVVVASTVALIAGAGCKKDDPAGSTTASGTGASSAAPDDSAGGNTSKVNYQTKMPARGTRPVTEKAVRGGAGDTVPAAQSKHLSEISTDRQMRKRAKVDKADCKAPNMDNAAECDGNDMYFCDDNKLWVVNCEEEAKFAGLPGGACFEGEKFIDCLGCGKADDGSDVCCDFQMTECCDKDGSCYSPK